MNAPLARLYSTAQMQQQDTCDERRREERHTTSFAAWLQTAPGERLDVRLTDVSLHGCCVTGPTGTLRQGSFISIGIGPRPPLKAVVRWVRSGAPGRDSAGMEFLRAVPGDAEEWNLLIDFGA
ncbi:PilZ domain-containing protein [Novosphingobium clariflavum]|uniref:PilZ domain-containing protein n=1 Tax=Novosphingobium clariflavum TaxID=2029884 RepID=A0ABV6S640_9SPHN|nr:PilZ domain-containing protein [Novosphingobium clariflavum]